MPNYAYSSPDQAFHILLVEDREFDREMMRIRLGEILSPESQIECATDGASALKSMKTYGSFDCIFLDMHLPDYSGLELTRHILNLVPEQCIIIITADSDMELALQCLKQGAEDFILKGEYSNDSLYRAMRYAIERHRGRLENIRLNHELHQARELGAMQREFIDLVSHEFRTPISIISGAAQMLEIKAPELAQGSGAAQFKRISDSVTRLTGLLDNVLRLSKMEDGKVQFYPEPFDMQQAIAECCDYFPPEKIHQHNPHMAAEYFGDRTLIQYALHNVISNAVKYSQDAAPVEVSMENGPGGITISVVDHGIGISPEAQSRIGEKFFRVKESSHIEGTGLGVYLARRFMGYHGGTLNLKSKPGKGTQVQLFFPHRAI